MNIVVKLPNNLDERILSFPFLHALKKTVESKLEDDQILNLHLISLKTDIDVLNLLPFTAFYHELEAEDVKSIFSVHRGVVELKIDKPEIYLSTTNSFVDASIGKNLKVPRRVGFATGKNKLFLTDKIEPSQASNLSDSLFPLLKSIDSEVLKVGNAYSRKVEPAYADWRESPYTVIDIPALKGELIQVYREFFDLCSNRNFVLMCSDLEEYQQEEQLNEFIKTLPAKNTYKLFTYVSNIDLARVVSHAITFVTWNRGLALLASYTGGNNFLLNDKDESKRYEPLYFLGEQKSVLLKKKDSDDYSPLFDQLFTFIERSLDPH